FYTLQTLPLATAVTLHYLSPIFTIIFAIFIVKESAAWRQWLAFLIALGGVVMVKGVDPRVSILSLTLGVIAAMCSGLAYNFIRKLRDYDDPLVVVFYFPLITVPVITPFLFTAWVWPDPLEWLILIGVGFATQGAQVAMTKAYSLEKASDIVIFKYLGIIYALLFGFFIFGESLDLLSLGGIVVVIGGVLLGTLGKRQARHIAPSAETFIKQGK
ncbi:MAG: DMT family transporter, partial [Chlorobiales bacterium]|nr:DMT family transporter [Chlorobiales bacterium]